MDVHHTPLDHADPEDFARPPRTRSSRTAWIVLGLLAALAVAVLVWLFEHMREPTLDAPARADSAPARDMPALKPAPNALPSAGPSGAAGQLAEPLPSLSERDPFVRSAIQRVVGAKAMGSFYPDEIVRRWVATIDNLPRTAPLWPLFPVRPAATQFAVTTNAQGTVIAPANAARYRPYAALVEATPAKLVVQSYVLLYPLLQQQYESLGYPGRQFNVRVIAALDDLLDAPEAPASLALVPGRVMYEFADRDLEDLSAGQKLMLRMGPENARVVKTKLREIRGLIEASTPTTSAAAPR